MIKLVFTGVLLILVHLQFRSARATVEIYEIMFNILSEKFLNQQYSESSYCDLVTINEILFRHEPFIETDLLVTDLYIPKKALLNSGLRIVSSEVPRHKCQCQHVFVYLKRCKLPEVKYGNLLTTHFVFIGSSSLTTCILKHDFVVRLKYVSIISIQNMDKYYLDHPKSQGIKPTSEELFRGQSLNMVVFPYEPYIIMDNGVPIGGFGWTFFQTMKNRYNFNGTFGFSLGKMDRLPNGSWTGVMGDLIDNRVDAIFTIVNNYYRHGFFDFTLPLHTVDLKFISSHPTTEVKWQAIFYPFDITVWCLIGSSFFFISGIFASVFKNSSDEPYYNAVYLSIRLLLNQSSSELIVRQGSYLTLVVLFYVLLINVFYNCNLLSYLTWPQQERIPRDIDQLADRLDYAVIFHYIPGGSGDLFFQGTKSTNHITVRERFIKERSAFECALAAVTQSKTTCVCWDILGSGIIAKNLSISSTFNPTLMSETILSVSPSVAMPRHSRFFDLFNWAADWFRDMGLVEFWRVQGMDILGTRGRAWMKTKCNDELTQKLIKARNLATQAKAKALKMENFLVAFFTLTIGTATSSVYFLLELLLFAKKFCFLN